MNGEGAAQVGWKALQLSSHDLARESVVGEPVLVRGRGVPLRREGCVAVRFAWGEAGKRGRQSSMVRISVASEAINSSPRDDAEIEADT